MTRLVSVVAICALLGCGARSVLELGGSGGAGPSSAATGAGGAGGGGATGGGGDGGTAIACTALEVGLGPAYASSPDPFFHTARPDLVGLENDGVAWVTSLIPVESPGPAPYGVGHAVLLPWSGSQLASTPLETVSFVGGRSVVSAETGRVGLYALALDLDEPPGPGAAPMRVVRTVDPEVSYLPMPDGVDVPAGPSRPELLVEMDDGLLYGWEISPSGGAVYLGLATIGDGVEVTTSADSACADPSLEVRAVPTTGGAIMAASSGREPHACFNDDGIPGPPRHLQTGFVDGETLFFDVAQSELFDEPILFLDLVGGGDHAWALWQTDGSLSEVSPAVRAVRLDPNGSATAPAVDVIPASYFPPYGVAAMGAGFAVAYFDAFDPGPPTLMVAVFDGEGQRIAEGSVGLSVFSFGERLAVMASPDQDAVLVGFGAAGEGGPNPTGFVRFDCLP